MRRCRATTTPSKNQHQHQQQQEQLQQQESNEMMIRSDHYHQNQNHQPANKNPICVNEDKIRTLLKCLQENVNKYNGERQKSDPNVSTINKTHEKLKKEDLRVSSFYRKKLQNLYATGITQAESEVNCLRQTLGTINQVRSLQNDIRLLQQQQQQQQQQQNQQNQNHSGLDLIINESPSSFSAVSPAKMRKTATSNNIVITTPTSSAGAVAVRKTATTTMRRGVLMSILQQAAATLPLWIGELDGSQHVPPLCGATPPTSIYLCKPGDKVAAIVKSSNQQNNNNNKNVSKMDVSVDSSVGGAGGGASGVDEENWILAEVVAYSPATGKYDVDDVDAEDGQERYLLERARVVPLPLWRANPITDAAEAIFRKDSMVLALYPQTTCFYRGIVSQAPQTPADDYLILFEDNTYPEGYSPPLNVPQLYVVVDHG